MDPTSSSSLPRTNQEYGTHEYWEHRFQSEASFEWLLSFAQLRAQLEPLLLDQYSAGDPAAVRILVVGCGNSPFSADLYDAGFTNIINIDYSATVIAQMQQQHAVTRPNMQWRVMDMTDLSTLAAESFDVVMDKAAMDALLTREGDVWHPDPECIAAVSRMCTHVARVLAPSGMLIQVSLSPPHFRKKYLLNQHEVTVTSSEHDDDEEEEDKDYCARWNWTLQCAPAGNDAAAGGCFGHYLYVMTKRSVLSTE